MVQIGRRSFSASDFDAELKAASQIAAQASRSRNQSLIALNQSIAHLTDARQRAASLGLREQRLDLLAKDLDLKTKLVGKELAQKERQENVLEGLKRTSPGETADTEGDSFIDNLPESQESGGLGDQESILSLSDKDLFDLAGGDLSEFTRAKKDLLDIQDRQVGGSTADSLLNRAFATIGDETLELSDAQVAAEKERFRPIVENMAKQGQVNEFQLGEFIRKNIARRSFDKSTLEQDQNTRDLEFSRPIIDQALKSVSESASEKINSPRGPFDQGRPRSTLDRIFQSSTLPENMNEAFNQIGSTPSGQVEIDSRNEVIRVVGDAYQNVLEGASDSVAQGAKLDLEIRLRQLGAAAQEDPGIVRLAEKFDIRLGEPPSNELFNVLSALQQREEARAKSVGDN